MDNNQEIYKDYQARANIIYMFAQLLVLAMVYLVVYISYLSVGIAIENNGVSVAMYVPILMVFITFPILLYKSRLTFQSGKMMVATLWMMGSASMSMLLLYVFLALITS